MASRSGSVKKSESALSEGGGEMDLLIAELKDRIAILENELRLKQECATFSDITERKQAEEALKLTQFALDNFRDSAIWLTPDGRIVYVNTETCKSLGYTKEELLSMHIWDIDTDYTQERLRELLPDKRQGCYTKFESTHVTRDGRVFPVEVTSCYTRYGDKEYLITFDRDITERKRTDAALRKSEEKYRRIVETANEGIWIIGRDTRTTFVNDKMSRMLGYTVEEMLGKKIEDFTGDSDLSLLHSSISRHISGVNIRLDHRFRRKDGTHCWFFISATPILDDKGAFAGGIAMITDITERKRAEEALRDSEEKYRFLVENSKDIIWKIDHQGRWTFVSSNVEKVNGYRPDEMVGKSIWDFIAPECHEVIREKLLKRMRGEEIIPYITWSLNKDGHRTPLEVVTTSILDDSGKIIGVQGISRDITLRMRAEEAQRQSEEKYRDLVENVNDIVWQIDERFAFTYISQRIFDVWGYTPEEVIGKTAMDFMPPDEAQRVFRWLEDVAVKRDKLYMFGNKQIRKDGGTVYLEVSGQPIIDSNGVLRGYRGTARDITERKRAEEALLESEEKFRVLAETSPAAIFLYQGEKFIYVNPMAEVLTGYSSEELLSGDAWAWIHADSLDLVKTRSRKRQLGERMPRQYEVKYRSKDGREGWVDFAAGLIEYRGKPAGLAMAFDVTKRKQAEAALKETKAQAELYVDLMGHDINNMNQISIGFLELAHNIIEMDGKLDEDNIVLLEKAMGSLKDSSQLIDSVRKIQREKMGLYEPQVLDVGTIIADAKKHFDRIPGRDVEIAYDQDKHYNVKANSLLKDVFINLIGNAIKHSKGPLAINIHASGVIDNDKTYCRVAVEDNGPGIPDALKSTLFDRLNLTSTRAKGKGFGLCLIKMLVDDYHGMFRVEDRVKGDHTQGARFVVMLPVAE